MLRNRNYFQQVELWPRNEAITESLNTTLERDNHGSLGPGTVLCLRRSRVTKMERFITQQRSEL